MIDVQAFDFKEFMQELFSDPWRPQALILAAVGTVLAYLPLLFSSGSKSLGMISH
jgi:hypothetical protein